MCASIRLCDAGQWEAQGRERERRERKKKKEIEFKESLEEQKRKKIDERGRIRQTGEN